MADPIPDALDQAAQDVPADLGAWLGRLVLLYGVPFSYVIPDEGMLPPESLRFFFVDPIWIQHLVQGACSIGNTDYGDTLIDQAMDKWTQPNQPGSGKQGAAVGKAAASVRDGLRQQYEGAPLPAESDDLNWPLTGFVLRSVVVTGWRGLEILAYRAVSADEKAKLDTRGYTDEQKAKAAEAKEKAAAAAKKAADALAKAQDRAVDNYRKAKGGAAMATTARAAPKK